MDAKVQPSNTRTVDAFCAELQKVVSHEVTIDANGEYVFTSPSGRFFKVAADADVQEALRAHEESNKGQVTAAQIAKENAAKLALLDSLVADARDVK